MMQGGMYDLTRGGFHRYSTDQEWRIPHFEKMLYDNAQLPKNYLMAGLLYRNPTYVAVAENTLDFLTNELQDLSGLFWSSIDADSEGKEGNYYIWDKELLDRNINQAGLELKDFERIPDNQLEGKCVVRFNSPNSDHQIHEINHPFFTHLRSIQADRPRPITDDKILTDWNALTIQAFIYAAWMLDRSDYKKIAIQAADQLLAKHFVNHRLRHSSRMGSVGKQSFLSDYAHFINALVDLFYVDKDKRWFLNARDLADDMIRLFYSSNVFFDTPPDEALIVRPRTLEDNVMPSGGSAALQALIKINLLHQNAEYAAIIETTLTRNLAFMSQYPLAAPNWLLALYDWTTPPQQLIVVQPENDQIKSEILKTLKSGLPRLGQLIIGTQHEFDRMQLDLFGDKNCLNHQTTFYLCRNHTCSLPTNSLEQILSTLQST
jgi:uncharacterized protein YyaL (SSP411 family)